MQRPYERFEAWQLCHDMAVAIYRVTAAWPTSERYGLSSQARRSAFSAAANIVEGSARRGRREFGRFLDISVGSLAELGYVLLIARDVALISADDWNRLESQRAEASRRLWGLYRAVRRA
jgi:four helix bundle protein